MGVISFVGVKGIKSEISPKLLPDGFSVECTNAFIDNGALTPWKGLEEIISLGKPGEIKTLHLINNETWLHFTEVAQLALAPIANNDKHYTIITGLDAPRYTDKDMAKTGGGTSWPNSTFLLGFPTPTLQQTQTPSVNISTLHQMISRWLYSPFSMSWGNPFSIPYLQPAAPLL